MPPLDDQPVPDGAAERHPLGKSAVGPRRRWAWILVLVVVLGAVEVAAAALVGHNFLPSPIAWSVDVLGVLLLLLGAMAVASTLWRRHHFARERTTLVLGYLGEIRFPPGVVEAVTPLRPLTALEEDQTGPAFDGSTLVLTAATGLPRVQVRFTVPQTGRRLWQRRLVDSVVVADPEGMVGRLESLD